MLLLIFVTVQCNNVIWPSLIRWTTLVPHVHHQSLTLSQFCALLKIVLSYTVFRKKVIDLFLPYISYSFWTNFTKLSVNIRK